MKKLGKLAAVIGLTFSIGLVALGGETQTPPCPPPDPGETQTPPCSGAQFTPGGDTQTGVQALPTAESIDYVITETTFELVQSVLSLL